MNSKQLYFVNNSNSVNITSYGNNGSLKTGDHVASVTDKSIFTENHLMGRLHELEESNARLEKLVRQRTKQIAEVVETNAKFLSILAHDLRNPFRSVLGVLDILQENRSEYDANEIEKYIITASDSALTTLSLLDNLVAWTASQNKDISFNPVKIDLYKLFLDEIAETNISASHKLISVNHSVTPGLWVTADRGMLKIVLRNLISNAIKFSNTGGEITISAMERNHCIEIEVKDNGIGMSQTSQRELFDIDELHSTTGTNNEHGSGLGLLLCKKFVEIHGGIIWIESESGKGTKMKLSLPQAY